jgi:transcriptional regulator with XRE-family HTH domain
VTLGQSIRLIRSSAGVRQHELAARLGVSKNYISLVEGGKREPSVAFLRRLSRELEVPVGVFFVWEDFDPQGRSVGNLQKFSDLIVRLEAMQLVATRADRMPKRKGK